MCSVGVLRADGAADAIFEEQVDRAQVGGR